MKYDYTGKDVFVGIDVHKKSYSVAVCCEQKIVKQWRMVSDSAQLIEQLLWKFEGARIMTAYEAGFSGFVLHRQLVDKGICNQVIHAGGMEVAANDKVKTDKRDAKKIAIQLAAGRLRGIHVLSEEQELARLISRRRSTTVKERGRAAARIKSLMHCYGLLGSEDTPRVNSQWIETIKTLKLPDELKYNLHQLIDNGTHFNDQIKLCDKELAEQAKVDTAKEKIYRSAPGVGSVAARKLSNHFGDMLHFSNGKN